MAAVPLSTGLVRLDIDMEADPEGLSPKIIEELARQMGGRNSWRFRKEMLRQPDAQSGVSVFPPEWLDLQQHKHVRPPLKRMEVSASGELYEKSDGRLFIWIPPDQMPRDLPSDATAAMLTFGMGMDVGAGTGQSNSTILGFATQAMEQAFEFASNSVSPTALGRIAAAIGRFYNEAMICCVQKMHGITTIRAMVDEGYPNLWRNVSHDTLTERAGSRIGWVHGENSKTLLMDQLGGSLEGSADVDLMSSRGVIIHSRELLTELGQYIYDDNQQMVLSKNKGLNPSARKAHGDRVVGAGLGVRACMDLPPYRDLRYAKLTPKTPEWYRQLYLDEQNTNKEEVWYR